VPLAGGTEPNAPVVLGTEPLELALEQAARPMAATTAHTVSAAARRGMRTGFPRDRVSPRLAREAGASFRIWVVCGRVIAAASPPEPTSSEARSVGETPAAGLA
jgi:hypothetical protein